MGIFDAIRTRKAKREFTGLAAADVPPSARQLQDHMRKLADVHLLGYDEHYNLESLNGDIDFSRSGGASWKQNGQSFRISHPSFSSTNPSFPNNIEHAVKPETYAELRITQGGQLVAQGPLGLDGTFYGPQELDAVQQSAVASVLAGIDQDLRHWEARIDGDIGGDEHVALMQSRRTDLIGVDDMIVREVQEGRPALGGDDPGADVSVDDTGHDGPTL